MIVDECHKEKGIYSWQSLVLHQLGPQGLHLSLERDVRWVRSPRRGRAPPALADPKPDRFLPPRRLLENAAVLGMTFGIERYEWVVSVRRSLYRVSHTEMAMKYEFERPKCINCNIDLVATKAIRPDEDALVTRAWVAWERRARPEFHPRRRQREEQATSSTAPSTSECQMPVTSAVVLATNNPYQWFLALYSASLNKSSQEPSCARRRFTEGHGL